MMLCAGSENVELHGAPLLQLCRPAEELSAASMQGT